MVNESDVIKRLDPVEYEQTQDLGDQYTPETPQSHQCGFLAQAAQQIDQLNHAVFGGEIEEYGQETKRSLNCNAIFTYGAKSHTRVEPTSEGSRVANGRTYQEIIITSYIASPWSATVDPAAQSRVVAGSAEGSSFLKKKKAQALDLCRFMYAI